MCTLMRSSSKKAIKEVRVNDLFRRFKNYISANGLLSFGSLENVVIGVSGGADSVCLLLLFYELKKEIPLNLTAVHVNHNIRGSSALSDQLFTEKLCADAGIELKVFSEDVTGYAKEHSLSLEEAGREIRYMRFFETAKATGAKVAVAHNARDNAETMIFNMIRGSRLSGLSGIRSKIERDGVTIIRPLLFADRYEIEHWLRERGQEYVTDETNADTGYSRNRIRQVIIKEMEIINPHAVKHINALGESAREAGDFLDKQLDICWEEACCMRGNEILLKGEAVRGYARLLREALVHKAISVIAGSARDITAGHVAEVLKLLNCETGKRVSLPLDIEAVKENEDLVFKKKRPQRRIPALEIHPETSGSVKAFAGLEFCFEILDAEEVDIEKTIIKNKYTKVFDCDKIIDSLFLRTRQTGDIIRLQNGSKSLNRFFIDSKIPRDKRDEIPVLADGSEIIWIVGSRISEAYKITDTTKKILKATYKEYHG